MKTIDRFFDEYRWLSNFWLVDVVFDGEIYRSVEHAYQAAKTNDRNERRLIQEAESPGQAKRLGTKITVQEDWDSEKLIVMEKLLRQKFATEDLKSMLIATGDTEIVEGNNWGDRYWGVSGGEGENHLGKIIMKIRGDLLESNESSIDSEGE